MGFQINTQRKNIKVQRIKSTQKRAHEERYTEEVERKPGDLRNSKMA